MASRGETAAGEIDAGGDGRGKGLGWSGWKKAKMAPDRVLGMARKVKSSACAYSSSVEAMSEGGGK